MSTEERLKISDPAVMRALAHPARLAIMEHLGSTRTDATATECAEVVGLSPSATSYHLRALAKASLIEEAPSRGDGRERVWRTRARGYATDAGLDADDETLAAEGALIDVFLRREDDRVRGWIARSRQEPPEWYEAAMISESVLLMTADELKALNQKVLDLVREYRRADRVEPPDGARSVAFQFRAVPIG